MSELPKYFDPATIEARWYRHWEESGLFRPDRKDSEPFTIVNPPPNVTGSLHIGHALDNILQDILIRLERLKGKDALWVVGTDHAGIATQMVVERQLAGGIGAVSARQMVSRIAKGEALSIDTVMALLEETQQAIEHSRALERKSEELRQTAEQLRAANEKLTQLDEMKDDFLSHVSHELRTPMTSIRSFSEFLNDQPDLDPERARRFIGIIFRESERLTRLLDEILDLGRMERDRMEWNLERVDAGQILSDAAATMAGLAERDGVVLTIERPAPALVEVDPDRLKQVFLNLLSNAVKFNTSERPTVLGSLRTLGQRVEIRVEDNGPGVSEGERGRLFTKFGRGWRDRAGRAKGSGLGLAICAQILRAFGGFIALERSSPKGSVFCVTLPLTQAEAPVSAGLVMDRPRGGQECAPSPHERAGPRS